jgi:hypothetical protein
MSTPDLNRIAAAMGGTVRGDSVHFPTPGHSRRDRGTVATLAPGAPDGLLVHSHNGGDPLAIKDELRATGLLPERPGRTEPARYLYRDAVGKVLCAKVRLDKPEMKYGWQHPVGDRWMAGRNGAPWVPYRLPELIASDGLIVMAEGEKHADKLASWGFTATSLKDWKPGFAPYIAGRPVAILPDNDDEGARLAAEAASLASASGCAVQIIDLPGLPPKGDIMDWSGTADDLRTLIDAAAVLNCDERIGPADPWPVPIPLAGELPPVAPCPPEMLPAELRDWLTDIAERMNVPLDMVAIPAMVAAGSLIGRRCGIRPEQHTDWQEAANLWGCVIAPPGALKSPAAPEALGPLTRLEAQAAEDNARAAETHKLSERLHKIQMEEADKAARKAIKDGGDGRAALARILAPEPPVERRFVTSDATAEKLGEICAANSMGVMVHRDELLALFADLDREERAAARGFFLTGWAGMEGYTFDRIQRGTVRIPAVNISLFGTSQPERIAGYIRDSLARFNDGMVQRLQLLAWPDMRDDWQPCDRAANADAKARAFACYSGLARLDTQELGAECGDSGFPFLRFAPDAQEAFHEWRRELERKIRDGDTLPALQAHLSKYRGLVPRLALVCHVASNAWGPVSREALDMALRWADYLESHARRAYGAHALDSANAARSIWRRIQRSDLPVPFTARDIQRKGWGGLSDKDRVADGLKALCEADWLAKDVIGTGAAGGRPTAQYRPNAKALKL